MDLCSRIRSCGIYMFWGLEYNLAWRRIFSSSQATSCWDMRGHVGSFWARLVSRFSADSLWTWELAVIFFIPWRLFIALRVWWCWMFFEHWVYGLHLSYNYFAETFPIIFQYHDSQGLEKGKAILKVGQGNKDLNRGAVQHKNYKWISEFKLGLLGASWYASHWLSWTRTANVQKVHQPKCPSNMQLRKVNRFIVWLPSV